MLTLCILMIKRLPRTADNRLWFPMPGLMPGPICVKLSVVAGVWWESDLGKKIFFFEHLDFVLFFKDFFVP